MSSNVVQDPTSWVLSQPTDDINKHYIIGKQLGQPGQFGQAHLVEHRVTGAIRAVKTISKSKFSRSTDRKIHFQELRNEIEIMKTMRHNNIIQLFDVFESRNELHIVMEICSGGELFDRIKAQPDGAYNEQDAAIVLRQICKGLAYLHEHKIAHCDLKPDNFLFIGPAQDAALKIIDFGMSKFVKRRKYFKSLRGTPYYIAPEVIKGRYSEHADMWSFGVVMFVMLFGYPPFHADNDNDIFRLVLGGFDPVVKKGFKAHFPSDISCSASARDLMSKLLTQDTAKRLTALEALEHPWLTGAEASNVPMVAAVLNNLKSFSNNYKFKQGVVQLFSKTLSKEELEQMKKTFASIDENGDGQITVAELAKAVEKAGSSARTEELTQLLKMADVDGDGTLSYDELVMSCVQRQIGAKEERLWNAFCQIDLDHDGIITAEELKTILGEDLQSAKKMIEEIDADKNGKIDFEEFILMWSKKEGANDTLEDSLFK